MTALSSLIQAVPAADRDFAEAFFAQVAPDDWALLTAAHVKAIVAGQRSLMKGRKAGQACIGFSTSAVVGTAWENRRTYLDIVTDDRPFLIDSVAALLSDKHHLIDLLLHPRLTDARGAKQSHMHIVLRGALSVSQQKDLEAEMRQVLDDVEFGTRDWQAMRLKAIEAKQHLVAAKHFPATEIAEYSDFLDYLYDNNFTFLGYREYRFRQSGSGVASEIVKGSGLGVLSDDKKAAYISETKQPLPSTLQELRLKLPPLHISKVNRVSTVHRRVPLDAVTVRQYDTKGRVTGEILFIGLFTSVTYSRSLRSIPLLKMKADQVLEKSGFEPASHDGRALRHILEKYPRDELFQIDVKELYPFCLSILRLQERQRIALYCRKDPFGRYVSCLVYVPRDRYDTRLRLKFQTILEDQLGGQCANFYSTVDDSPLVRILYVVTVSQSHPRTFDGRKIEELLQHAGRAWSEGLADALHRAIEDDSEAVRLAGNYADAFSSDYRERYPFDEAVADIVKIESCLATKTMQVDLRGEGEDLRLKVYTQGSALVLSDILPVLENMGLRVLTEHPFSVLPHDADMPVIVQDFSLYTVARGDISRLKPLFEDAFIATQNAQNENDSLNTLVLSAGLSARDVMIVRTFVRYLRQAAVPFSLAYMEQAVVGYPAYARLFVELFRATFDPTRKGHRALAAIEKDVSVVLDSVTSLDHDRILRALNDVLKATVRTNFWQDKPYLSVKLKSRDISFLPNPKPFREIFVYSPRMEGVHLRADRIARGGIRWSDRAEDFRTEVLGLMKAQNVKNSVIVPMGAKGGFIVKRPPAGGDRAAMQAEGIECYRTLVRGLLDITDNLNKSGKIIKPKDVVCLDADDPYLVVAADKGTATFSDIANQLSADYGFWMADAFASGGSAGYDHKKMGITSRGSWESVKRHFRELGHDTQSADFDVVAVGDMAGDVFGNGMLQSKHIRLIGAFNHVHIFCDPECDSAESWVERKRLFDGVLGWDAYNVKKLGKGGRIFRRDEKVLDLTPEIQKRFDLPKAKVSPPELIQAMLKARTDLLYFGGIGVFVKAGGETHAEARDRSNDALRVNAADLRAKVLGEGANLAVTQRARVEYAMKGGRLNADFIDNSAGVDTSDHEVNIKILLSTVTAKSPDRLPRAARDKLLRSMTDEVAALVLADNYQQTQALSLVELQAADALPAQQRFVQELEREGMLDRALEGLPDDETIAARIKAGKGLVRSESAVLLSYAKIRCTFDLLESDVPDSGDADSWVMDYFPRALQQKYKAEILRHPLRREIVATGISNSLVNRMGPTFMKARMRDFGVSADVVARAYLATAQILGLQKIWRQIEGLDGKVPAAVQLRAFRDLARLTDNMIGWLLTTYGAKLLVSGAVKAYGAKISEVSALLKSDSDSAKLLTPAQMDNLRTRLKQWNGEGVPTDLARILAVRGKVALVPSIVQLAAAIKKPLRDTAGVYFQLGDIFAFSWLSQQITYLPQQDRWSMEAARSLQAQIVTVQGKLARRVLSESKTLPNWIEKNKKGLTDTLALISDLKRAGLTDVMPAMVLLQRVERLAG